MSNKKEENKKTETFEKLHNRKPVTRREFLSTGLIPFAANLVAPNILNMFTGQNAFADASRCGGGGGSNMPAFINVNLAGGSGLSSHALGLDEGGQLLPSYTRLGLGVGSQLSNMVTTEFGGSRWFSNSTFLQGFKTNASMAAMANTAFVSVCVETRDDSADNPIDISGMVDRIRNGEMLPGLNGNRNKPALVVPKPSVNVRSLTDLGSSVLLSGNLQEKLSKSEREKLLKLVNNLSTSQMRKVASFTYGDQVQNLLNCAGIKNSDLVSKGADQLGINPIDDAAVSALWGIDMNSDVRSRDVVLASIGYNTIKGNSSLGNISLGGYDYHNGTRTSGDAKDLEAGEVVGSLIQTAHLLGKKLFLTVTTDGGVNSMEAEFPGEGAWTSDAGNRGMMYIFAYDPARRPIMKGHQVGNYTKGQVVNDKTKVGGSPEMAAAAVFANYLSFAGNLSAFEQIVGRGALNPTELDEVSLIVG